MREGGADQVRGGDDIGAQRALPTGVPGRVVGIERDKSLVLRAEMKLPGVAVLEFCIERCGDNGCRLKQNAKFQPKGLLGLLYWYSVLPFHHFVFRGMLEGIKTQAQKFATGQEHPSAHEALEPSR